RFKNITSIMYRLDYINVRKCKRGDKFMKHVITGKSKQFFEAETFIRNLIVSNLTECREGETTSYIIPDQSIPKMCDEILTLFQLEDKEQKIKLKQHFMETVADPWNRSDGRQINELDCFMMVA